MRRKDFYQEEKIKKYAYTFGITLALSIVVFLTIFVMYNKKMKKESLDLENLGIVQDIVSNDNIKETSYSSDLALKDTSVNKISNTANKTVAKKKVNKTPVESTVTNTQNVISNIATNILGNSENKILENSNIVENQEVKKELHFQAPVAGEIIKDFAIENLIYSTTLEEWTTHSGIDIKAEKTSVVAASEAGTVESIKNDPRFGLSITISHGDGFKTIYSNLLTTEFVSENEVVEKGQTIATVGETASFEVADEPHLHFEIYKDGIPVNPTIYLK